MGSGDMPASELMDEASVTQETGAEHRLLVATEGLQGLLLLTSPLPVLQHSTSLLPSAHPATLGR